MKKLRRGKRKRKEPENESAAGTANSKTVLRRMKRSKIEGSGISNRKKIEQRTRKRLKKRLEKDNQEYNYIDPWTRIKFGPRTFGRKIADPKLPSFLEEACWKDICNNLLLQQLVNHLHDKVYDNKCGKINIEWSNDIHRLSAGECVSENMMEHTIRINPNLIYSKLELYLVVAHELAHAHVAATRGADDRNHGNPFIKSLEKFLTFDSDMDVYMPISSSPNFKKYVYECIDEKCGKMYARNSPRLHCYCGDDLLCYIENVCYVPADKFLRPIEYQAMSSEDELRDD